MNNNTVAYAPGLPGVASGGTAMSTTETQLKDNFDAPDGSSAPKLAVCSVPVSGYESLGGGKFNITLKAHYAVTNASATTLTVKVYAGKDTTISNNTALFTSGAITVTNSTGNFFLTLEAYFDATTLKLEGIGYGAAKNTSIAQAALSNIVQLVDGLPLYLTATAQFSASDAGNSVTLDELSVESE